MNSSHSIYRHFLENAALMNRMPAYLSLLILAGVLSACGGGGGGGSDSTPVDPPPPTNLEPEPTVLTLVDSLPGASATGADPDHKGITFSHFAQSDLSFSVSGDCGENSITVRRDLVDMATQDFDQLVDHKITCNGLQPSSSVAVTADGVRPNDARFRASLSFSTTTAASQEPMVVTDSFSVPRGIIDDIFSGYVQGALPDELDLPPFIEGLVIDAIIDISEANWDNLVNPDPLYDVAIQRVSYKSRDPAGNVNNNLTGLIARPTLITAVGFTQRDRIIVLNHATGSTPGDLSFRDAWFILAIQFASRGYLVIAPDNWGRGGTAAEAETYLMANRTAANSLDLISAVVADPTYDEVYDGGEINELTLIGYSQGGHSAIALWQTLETQGPANLATREVYSGGAPHDLYQTVRGVLQHVDGSCNGGAFCRNVDSATTLPFATDRILPGFLAYADTGGLTEADLIVGDDLNPDFVAGFLANEPEYDALKAVFQLSSFTNIASVPDNFGTSQTLIHLYHSEFDRLVPPANTQQLANILQNHVTVDFHENRCNSDGYEVIFNVTDIVGTLHTLCGLAVLDDAMEDLQ